MYKKYDYTQIRKDFLSSMIDKISELSWRIVPIDKEWKTNLIEICWRKENEDEFKVWLDEVLDKKTIKSITGRSYWIKKEKVISELIFMYWPRTTD